jgi:hypothetical protein
MQLLADEHQQNNAEQERSDHHCNVCRFAAVSLFLGHPMSMRPLGLVFQPAPPDCHNQTDQMPKPRIPAALAENQQGLTRRFPRAAHSRCLPMNVS